MDELQRLNGLPHEIGWYWVRHSEGVEAVYVQRDRTGRFYCYRVGSLSPYTLTDFEGGTWYKVPPPPVLIGGA